MTYSPSQVHVDKVISGKGKSGGTIPVKDKPPAKNASPKKPVKKVTKGNNN